MAHCYAVDNGQIDLEHNIAESITSVTAGRFRETLMKNLKTFLYTVDKGPCGRNVLQSVLLCIYPRSIFLLQGMHHYSILRYFCTYALRLAVLLWQVARPLVVSSAADASADQELLSYDFDKEGEPWTVSDHTVTMHSTHFTISTPECTRMQ